jgi:hypothetical protein
LDGTNVVNNPQKQKKNIFRKKLKAILEKVSILLHKMIDVARGRGAVVIAFVSETEDPKSNPAGKVARSFLAQHTKMGKYKPHDHKTQQLLILCICRYNK